MGNLQVGLEQQALGQSRCFGKHCIDGGAGAGQVTIAGLQLDQRDLRRKVVGLQLHRLLECGDGALVVAVAGISPARPVSHRRPAFGLRDRILRRGLESLLAFFHRDQGVHQAGQGAFGRDLEFKRPAELFLGRARIAVGQIQIGQQGAGFGIVRIFLQRVFQVNLGRLEVLLLDRCLGLVEQR